MITLNFKGEQGEVEQVEVSEDFMELCWKQARIISEQAQSTADVVTMIENTTTDDRQRSILADMVLKQLQGQTMIKLIGKIIEELVGE